MSLCYASLGSSVAIYSQELLSGYSCFTAPGVLWATLPTPTPEMLPKQFVSLLGVKLRYVGVNTPTVSNPHNVSPPSGAGLNLAAKVNSNTPPTSHTPTADLPPGNVVPQDGNEISNLKRMFEQKKLSEDDTTQPNPT